MMSSLRATKFVGAVRNLELASSLMSHTLRISRTRRTDQVLNHSLSRSVSRIAVALTLVVSVLVVVPPTPAGAVGETSDDFNSTTLDGGVWTEVVGTPGPQFAYTGAEAAIVAPTGFVSFDPWTAGNTAPVLVQDVSDGDLDVVAAFATVPEEQFQIQGIVVANAADDAFIRFDAFSDGTNTHIFAAEPLASATPLIDEIAPSADHAKFIRVMYDDTSGDWTLLSATERDPAVWTDHGTFNRPMNVGRIGPFGGTSFPSFGEPAPGHVAFVDYFGVLPIPANAVSDAIDTTAPVNSTRSIEKTTTSMKVTWTTSEPTISTLRVDGGTGVPSTTDSPSYGLNHEVNLTGLTANTAYSLEITSTDVNGNADVDTEVQNTPATDNAPVVTFWYGDTQTVGGTGDAQRWFDLLGNVTDPDGVSFMSYSLNSATPVAVSVGPDDSGRRLENTGDFVVDVLLSDLDAGENTIEILARDNNGQESTKTATIIRVTGVDAPPAAGIDWTDVPNIGSVTSPVDGLWSTPGDSLQIVEPGYDRILAIGDTDWVDYEVLVPVTVTSMKADKDDAPSFGSGVGVFLRWNGHNNTVEPGEQPLVGFWPDGINPTPLGAIAWWAAPNGVAPNDPGSGQLEILDVIDADGIGTGADPGVVVGGSSAFALTFGTTYLLRAQVEGDVYRLKFWPQGSAEPGAWTIEYNGAADANDPASGALALVAHEATATFGDVIVTPLSASGASDPTVMPVLDPVSGSTVGQSTSVTATGAAGATIHYTTDGSTPTPLSPVYSSGAPVGADMRFIAYEAGKDPSDVVIATFTVNDAPVVDAGADVAIEIGDSAALAGSVVDDSDAGSLQIAWSVASGPGVVSFAESTSAATTATFTAAGVYRLVLTADDGQEIRTDEVTVTISGGGYWLANAAGRVVAFGLDDLGDLSGTALSSSVAGIAATPTSNGYWLTQANGIVTPFGAAPDFSDLADFAVVPTSPIVDIAATSSGAGAYLLGADGGVFALGDAEFFGSTGDIALDQPIVAMANHATGRGYWFVASDGGVFTFGPDAPFLGSVPEVVPFDQLAAPIVGMAVTPSGNGYWLVASDGGIFAFGDAAFYGSIPGVVPQGLDQPIVGMVSTKTGNGYWLVARDGGVFAFGDAPFLNSDPTLGEVVGLAG